MFYFIYVDHIRIIDIFIFLKLQFLLCKSLNTILFYNQFTYIQRLK